MLRTIYRPRTPSTLVVLLLAAGGHLAAQTSIGFKAGVISTKFNVFVEGENQSEDIDYFTSFQLSVPLEIHVNDFLAFQPEVNFVRQGFRSAFSETIGGVTFESEDELRFNSLELPLLVKVGRLNHDGFTVAVAAGPAVNYIVSGRSSSTFNGQTLDEKIEFDEGDGLNRLGVYGVIGAHAGLPLPFGRLTLDARFRQQISNVADVEDDLGEDFTARFRGFSVGAGVLVALGR